MILVVTLKLDQKVSSCDKAEMDFLLGHVQEDLIRALKIEVANEIRANPTWQTDTLSPLTQVSSHLQRILLRQRFCNTNPGNRLPRRHAFWWGSGPVRILPINTLMGDYAYHAAVSKKEELDEVCGQPVPYIGPQIRYEVHEDLGLEMLQAVTTSLPLLALKMDLVPLRSESRRKSEQMDVAWIDRVFGLLGGVCEVYGQGDPIVIGDPCFTAEGIRLHIREQAALENPDIFDKSSFYVNCLSHPRENSSKDSKIGRSRGSFTSRGLLFLASAAYCVKHKAPRKRRGKS